MALGGRTVRTGVLLGWTDPRPYEAGVVNGVAFPAGESMTIWFGSEPHDVDRLKVKSGEVPAIHRACVSGGLYAVIDVEFSSFNGELRAHSVAVVASAAA